MLKSFLAAGLVLLATSLAAPPSLLAQETAGAVASSSARVYKIDLGSTASPVARLQNGWVEQKQVAWIQVWGSASFRLGFTDGTTAEGRDDTGAVVQIACTARATGLALSLYLTDWETVTDVTLH